MRAVRTAGLDSEIVETKILVAAGSSKGGDSVLVALHANVVLRRVEDVWLPFTLGGWSDEQAGKERGVGLVVSR